MEIIKLSYAFTTSADELSVVNYALRKSEMQNALTPDMLISSFSFVCNASLHLAVAQTLLVGPPTGLTASVNIVDSRFWYVYK
jgi:hypothetical protein